MKFGNNEVLEVSIFDKDGKSVTNLNTLKNSRLIITNDFGYLIVTDALLDEKFLKFIGYYEEDNSSDFEKYLNKSKYRTTITFNKNIEKECKIIGKGKLRHSFDCSDKEFIFEIPSAATGKEFKFNKEIGEISEFDFVFIITPYNENGDLFKMHIE